MRKIDRPRVTKTWSQHASKMAKVKNPSFPDRCMTCGLGYHSSVDRYFCDPKRAYCVYPNCHPENSTGQTGPHHISVCYTLQWGCSICKMRGHHSDECKGTEPNTLEDNKCLFELYADEGYNTRKRHKNPYIGCVYMPYACLSKRDRDTCPWEYKRVLEMTVVDFQAEVLKYVVDHSGPQQAKRGGASSSGTSRGSSRGSGSSSGSRDGSASGRAGTPGRR